MIDVVCAILSDGEGNILACRRPAGRHLAGRWEFPGGKVESGESPQAALARELREELGVEVEVGEAAGQVEWAYPTARIRLSAYHCKIRSGVLRLLEHDEVRWCGRDALASLLWADADVPLVEALLCRNP